MLSIILIIIGAVVTILGFLTNGGVAIPLLSSHPLKIGVSFILFGLIILIAGLLVLLSSKNETARLRIKAIVNMKEFTLILVFVFFIYFFWMVNENYLSLVNIRSIFNSAFVMGTLAVGISCLLISGKIDLSAGNTGMMAGIIVALLMKAGMPWVPALIITLAFGAVTGLINSFFINGLGFAPFISTLAVSTIYSGLSLVITNAANVPINNKSFLSLGSTNISIFPLSFLIMIVLVIVYGLILSRTGFGRRIYMTGGNSNAARLAGINPKRITTILFVNGGVIASLAGAILSARMSTGSPSSVTGSDLDAITSIILGGVAFTGGSGNMFGVFIGVILITSFQNGLIVSGLNSYYQVIAKGLLLVAALILDYYRESARIKAIKNAGTEDDKVAA